MAPRMSTTLVLRQLYNNPKGHIMASGGNPDSLKDEDIAASVSCAAEVFLEFRFLAVASLSLCAVSGLCGRCLHGGLRIR